MMVIMNCCLCMLTVWLSDYEYFFFPGVSLKVLSIESQVKN